jgi:hypothetical protein
VRRWLLEAIHLLAARAERLDRALKKIVKRGEAVVLIDGTPIPTRRRTGADDRPDYSGKRTMHGLHVLALTDEKGNLSRVSAARRGRTHDVTAARHDHITTRLREAGLGAIADLGFLGLDDDPDRYRSHQPRDQQLQDETISVSNHRTFEGLVAGRPRHFGAARSACHELDGDSAIASEGVRVNCFRRTGLASLPEKVRGSGCARATACLGCL